MLFAVFSEERSLARLLELRCVGNSYMFNARFGIWHWPGLQSQTALSGGDRIRTVRLPRARLTLNVRRDIECGTL